MLPSGSSPLARGLLNGWHHDRGQHRIIPARAGFTRSAGSTATTRPDHPRSRGVYGREDRRPPPRRLDHPRSRGVYLGAGPLDTPAGGSSPLARGLRYHDP